MEARTVTTVLDAPREQVFRYLADVANLPDWATEFARELRFEDGKAKVVNGLGEFYFEIEADPDTGVIDMYAGPTEDDAWNDLAGAAVRWKNEDGRNIRTFVGGL